MTRCLLAYAGTLASFCVLDFLWLGFVARDFYQSQVGPLLLARPNWGAAAVFYAVYAAGIALFAVAPALDAQSLVRAIIFGFLFGLFAYATYDLTNLATLKGWTLRVAAVDILWGGIVSAAAAAGGFALARLAVEAS
jgi:uncharacterized membrane protein